MVKPNVVLTGNCCIANSAGALDIQQTYTLTNAIISAFEQGPISANGLLQESISFSFQKFELKSGTASAIFDSVGAWKQSVWDFHQPEWKQGRDRGRGRTDLGLE